MDTARQLALWWCQDTRDTLETPLKATPLEMCGLVALRSKAEIHRNWIECPYGSWCQVELLQFWSAYFEKVLRRRIHRKFYYKCNVANSLRNGLHVLKIYGNLPPVKSTDEESSSLLGCIKTFHNLPLVRLTSLGFEDDDQSRASEASEALVAQNGWLM